MKKERVEQVIRKILE